VKNNRPEIWHTSKISWPPASHGLANRRLAGEIIITRLKKALAPTRVKHCRYGRCRRSTPTTRTMPNAWPTTPNRRKTTSVLVLIRPTPTPGACAPRLASVSAGEPGGATSGKPTAPTESAVVDVMPLQSTRTGEAGEPL